MNETKRNWGRVALYASVAGAMVVSLVPFGAHSAAAQGATRKIGDFDVAGRFLEVWQAQGNDQASTYVNGNPITARRAEISTEDGKTYDSQWFERAKYEAHPENKAPYDVLLGRLGANFVEGRGSVDGTTGKVRNPADAPFVKVAQPSDLSATKIFFPETGHTVSGKILEYWNRYGGLSQFGYPLSEAFNEPSTDGKTYSTQYFERARFEVHPEKAAPYEVELGLLGVQQYKTTPVAADKLPIAPPAGVTSTKDTYTGGSLQEPDTLFCNEANTVVAQRFCAAITFQDGLVTGDEKENYFPLAAWYVPTLENGGSFFVGNGDDRHLVTKYKLRKGIKWSNGTEVTSADAVFSYKFVLDDPNSVSVALFSKLSFVDNPDKYTVIYNWMSLNQAKAKLADPNTDQAQFGFLNVFIDAKSPIVDINYFLVGTVHPKSVLEKIPVDKVQESSEGQKPTGYGPYIVQEWKQGDSMTLVKNPNYNLTAPPLINRLINRFNPDVNAQVNAFLTGQLDGIESEGFVVPPDQSDQIKAAGGVVSNVPAASWEHLEPVFQDALDGYTPFGDLAVRQALMYGINRDQIVKTVFKGAGAVMNGPNPPAVWHSLENPNFAKEFPDIAAAHKLPLYAYDVAKANATLDAAGWVKGGDGIREKGGQKLSFEYATTRNTTRQAIQALIGADLKAIGMDPVITNYPTGYFNPDGPKATRKTELAEFAYVGTSSTNYDPYDSKEWNTDENPGAQNNQHYKNDKVDQANRKFSATVDRKELALQSAIVQEEMMKDVAVIPLVQRANIEIYSGKMMNRKTTNTSIAQWWNVSQWYFK
jgi:peptide/nickel transport system substrate-binding protein